MSALTPKSISSSSDDDLFALLGRELESRIRSKRGSPEFVAEIQKLPEGLRAMAATYELDVSLSLDDLGFHFGNWHDKALAEETAHGLEILGASELAAIFRDALSLALPYWTELGTENWSEWYHDSDLERAVGPLNKRACEVVKQKKGILEHWVNYARKHPDRVCV